MSVASRSQVRIAPYDKVIVALATKPAEPVPAPAVHALDSTADVVAADGQDGHRTSREGRQPTRRP